MNITDNLVLGLTLEDILSDNTVADLSANGFKAQVVGQPELVPDDYFGSCIDFDGSVNQYVKIEGFNAFPQTALTVACWVKSSDTSKSSSLISFASSGSDNAFLLFNTRNLTPYINAANQQTGIAVNDGVWHHVAVTWQQTTGVVLFYLDGELAFTTKALSTQAISADGFLVLGQEQDSVGGGFDAKQALKGQMAHVYIYDQVLGAAQINQLMTANKTAQASFKSEYPVDFKLLDDGEDHIFYINDSQTSNVLVLSLINCSFLNLLLQPSGNKSPGENNHHFSLTFKAKTFEKKLLNDDATQTYICAKDVPKGWQVSRTEELFDGRIVVYLLYTGVKALLLEKDKSIDFVFEYNSADGDIGARGTNVALEYQNLSYENKLEMLSGSRIQKVDIINHRGKKSIPLFASIVGSNRILNDANSGADAKSSASSVIIRLVNTMKKVHSGSQGDQLMFNVANVNAQKNTEFTLVFDDPVGEDWDLASTADLQAVVASVSHSESLTVTKLTKKVQGDRPVFSFVVPVASLQAGEYLDITLSNIRSNCASGFANIYINYEDIPGYWDSHFVVQVEKSPIVHRDFDGQRNVGIGKYPSNGTKLDVEGDAAFAGNVDIGILTGSAHDYNMAQNTISGGGIVSWNGKGAKGGLLWTKRFIAITAEKNHTFRSGYVDFRPPTTGIPASHVYDGKKRDYSDEKGLILDSWDALYAVHTPGGDHSQIEYRIQSYNKNFNTASHWFLIAVCNGDNNSIKLSSGLTLSMGEIVDTSKGLIPCGIIVMWNGTDIAIPAGWSLCNGSNGTPDLRDRFVVGAGNGSQYQLKSTGGADSVTLSRSQMPKHNHSGSATSGEHQHIIPTDSGGGGLGWGQARTISANVYNDSKSYANANSYAYTLGDNVANWSNPSPKSGKGEHTHKLVIGQSGSGLGHENRPPYYALCYIMKL